jgi:muconolactone delta-isomerase
MPVYLVDRNLPGVTADQLAAAQKAAIETSRQFSAQGKPVRYIRSTFVPGESHCMCLFEASNADLVKQVNETAKIPFTKIIEAMDLTPK